MTCLPFVELFDAIATRLELVSIQFTAELRRRIDVHRSHTCIQHQYQCAFEGQPLKTERNPVRLLVLPDPGGGQMSKDTKGCEPTQSFPVQGM